jgi:hypothetical protein
MARTFIPLLCALPLAAAHLVLVRPMPRDARFGLWNTLHDGEITAVSADAGTTVTIFVSIPYLRRRLRPLGDSFVLTLLGVRQLQFRDFSGTISSLRDELEFTAPEILSSESENMPVTVETTGGQLFADFVLLCFAEALIVISSRISIVCESIISQHSILIGLQRWSS